MRRGDIAYIDFPLIPRSHVQGGRRPTVLVSADEALRDSSNSMVMVVPLTTNLAANRFSFTFQVVPSRQNGLSSPSIALVYQLCGADRFRLSSVIGHLEDIHLAHIDEMLRQMLGLEQRS